MKCDKNGTKHVGKTPLHVDEGGVPTMKRRDTQN
jgi:hypothetical protein